jgi:hypothetical protein
MWSQLDCFLYEHIHSSPKTCFMKIPRSCTSYCTCVCSQTRFSRWSKRSSSTVLGDLFHSPPRLILSVADETYVNDHVSEESYLVPQLSLSLTRTPMTMLGYGCFHRGKMTNYWQGIIYTADPPRKGYLSYLGNIPMSISSTLCCKQSPWLDVYHGHGPMTVCGASCSSPHLDSKLIKGW